MAPRILAGLLILAVLLFGCTQAPQGGADTFTPPTDGNGDSGVDPAIALSGIDSDLDALQDELAASDNILGDAEGTDDLQVLEVDESLFQ